jgi:uncharacterized membrane protein YidH (DUF202 family)
MLAALSISAIFYVFNVFSLTFNFGTIPSPNTPALVVLTFVTVVLAIIGHILIALTTPKEANEAVDERERLIILKAGHISSYILGVGVILALALFLVIQHGSILFYTCLASLILSQLAKYILHIVLNRISLN